MDCYFCNVEEIVLENDFAIAFYDKFPVTEGHLLIVPKAHKQDYFCLSLQEKQKIAELIEAGKKLLDATFAPDGYNIGVNCGEAAGQTIFHCHIHLIPRYNGDTPQPKGGVRGVIPEKQQYG